MIDRIGLAFGRLTIKSVAPESHPKNIRYLCQCDCGNEKSVSLKNLQRGNTKSCGCLAKENMERLLRIGAENKAQKIQAQKMKVESRGESKGTHELYNTWRGMIRRCYDPTVEKYAYYGAKGVTVCERWKADFWNFIADMGVKPSKEHSLDRVDPTGNYEPSNCRWANRYVQATNKRQYQKVPTATIKGRTFMCSRWAQMLDISQDAITNDIKKGHSPEVAVIATKMRKALWLEKKGTPSAYEQCYEEAKKYLQKIDKSTTQS